MNKSIFNKTTKNNKNVKSLNINFGPNHPAAHGVLRMILKLDGEIIEDVDTHVGLLHRGTEKLMEQKPYIHSIPYFDRLDYVSMLIQEHAYCLAMERLMKKEKFFQSFNMVRTMYDEMTRILNHLMAIGSHTLDIGAMAPIFWGFEERENIMEFYERVCGARMHAAFYRPNRMNLAGFSDKLIMDILNAYTTFNEINSLVVFNKIWKHRMVGVGIITRKMAKNNGLTGVLLRSTGEFNDIRLNLGETYSNYYYIDFNSFVGYNGDTYDRYLIRMNEMIESLNIVNYICDYLLDHITNDFNDFYKFYNRRWKKNPYKSMEAMIQHFKYRSEGIKLESSIIYSPAESPKGEFGVLLFTDNSNKPYRCKIRSPAYYNIQILSKMAKGHMLADLVSLIGTVDIVFGEIDR